MFRFEDRVAIITGAGNGLGRAYALDLAARGARVVVNNRRRATDAPGETSAERTVAEIRAAGGTAVADFEDVRVEASGARMVAHALDTWGRLDIVINNAGVGQHRAFHDLDIAGFLDVFEVNFHGSLYLTHAACLHMRTQSYGRIVMSASSAGLHGLHGLSAYSASKAALVGLMRALAQEGARRNIACNAICPYATTNMTAAQSPAEMARTMPPELVAPMVAYLASETCRLNGRIIVAGKGAFRRAAMVEGAGLGYRTAAEITPESIERDLARIVAIDGVREFPDALRAFEDFYAANAGVA
jgi:NAD(P)-dependent dehydrogenase (short-subunit alcohol dehydrogenase family)